MLRATFITIVAAAILVACSDDKNMVAPRPVSSGTGAKVSRTALSCRATLHPQSVTCTPLDGGSSAATAASRSTLRKNVIVGKQNVYVTLALNTFAYSTTTHVFSFNATVQNLMTQPIGTQDGSTVAGGGVDVFFTNGPFVACGTGTVAPIGTSTGTFTASGQPYYQYNQIIKSDSVSASKSWSFQLSSGVCGFNFFVEVSADMPFEKGVLLWTPIHQGVSSNQLNGVWQDSSDDVFAAGLNGTVMHYDGTQWSQLALNQPTYQIRAVSGSSRSDVWFVGDAGLAVHYNGSTFTKVTTPSAANLKGVWEITPTNIYAVGSTGGQMVVFQSTNGTSWTNLTTVPHGVADTIRAVWAADASHIFMVGDAGRIVTYNGNGTTGGWTQITKPAGNPPFRGVWGTSATNVFAVATNGSIYHYTGTTWTAMTSNTTSELDAVGGTSSTNVWAVGANGTMVRYNGAGNWTYNGQAIGVTLRGITTTNGITPIWAVGDAGTLVSINGTTATVSNQSGFPIFRIWAASDTSVWATTVGSILHYDGNNWSVVYTSSTPADTMLGLWGFSPTDVHTLTVNGNVAIWNGTSWTATPHGGTSWRAEWGDQADTLVLCAASQAGTIYCNDTQTNATAGTAQLMGLWGASNKILYTTNVLGAIYQSTDSGRTFNPMTSGTTDTLFAVWGTSTTQLWAVGQAGTIVANSGSATWTAQTSGTTNDLRWLWGEPAPAGYTGDAYAVGDNGTILHYNGNQWSPMWSGLTTTLRSIYGTSATNVYIGGDNGVALLGSQ